MTRKLFISGNLGTMIISDGTIPDYAASQSPITYRNNLYFHSGLPYIQIKRIISPGNIVFPAQDRGVTTWSDGSKGCGGLC